MKKRINIINTNVNWCQIFLGVAALLVGTLVYLVDRPPGQSYFVYTNRFDISLYNILPNIFGVAGNSLPAFIHVLSFILITAGLIASQKNHYLIICTCWLLVDCAFELGQKYDLLAAGIVPDWFVSIPYLENAKNYFLRGTFDYFDMVFILAGTIGAYLVLINTNKVKKEVSL